MTTKLEIIEAVAAKEESVAVLQDDTAWTQAAFIMCTFAEDLADELTSKQNDAYKALRASLGGRYG